MYLLYIYNVCRRPSETACVQPAPVDANRNGRSLKIVCIDTDLH